MLSHHRPLALALILALGLHGLLLWALTLQPPVRTRGPAATPSVDTRVPVVLDSGAVPVPASPAPVPPPVPTRTPPAVKPALAPAPAPVATPATPGPGPSVPAPPPPPAAALPAGESVPALPLPHGRAPQAPLPERVPPGTDAAPAATPADPGGGSRVVAPAPAGPSIAAPPPPGRRETPSELAGPAAPRGGGPSGPASAGVGRVADAPARVDPPAPLRVSGAYPKPDYPALSRRLGESGRVMVRVLVGADGAPSRVTLAGTSGFRRLDQAALAAVMTWRFQPGRRAGIAEAMWVDVPVDFVLE